MLNTIENYIESERNRFECREDNLFAFCFTDIMNYYIFLLLILKRMDIACTNLNMANTKIGEMLKKRKHQSGRLNIREMAKLNDASECLLALRFEIECFFVFAKILLDRISRSIELYFGPERKKSLDSHDQLCKQLFSYSSLKNLDIEDNLISMAKSLKTHISDFRDYEIAHNKSPRVMKHCVAQDSSAKMVINMLYPKDNEVQKESKLANELFTDINSYISMIIEFLKTNKDKTNLKLKQPKCQI